MKGRFTMCLLLFYCWGFSQARQTNFNVIDRQARIIDEKDPAILACKLTAAYTSDLHKVRSIFSWITSHISYNVYRNSSSGKKIKSIIIDDDTGALKPLNERVAIHVLNRKMAVCDGYAKLFKTLCDYAGLKSEVVTGYAKTNYGNNDFRTNHSWNAVYIDSTWHLLDVTWATGYITYYSNEFVFSLDEKYFLTPPQQFIKDHYPEELKWTLLTNPPVIKEFKQSPFINGGYTRQRIVSFSPAAGTINATIGDSITIEVAANIEGKKLVISDESFIDTGFLYSEEWQNQIQPANLINENKVSVTYRVTSPLAQWLNIIYNGEVIMRYRLNIHKEEEVVINLLK